MATLLPGLPPRRTLTLASPPPEPGYVADDAEPPASQSESVGPRVAGIVDEETVAVADELEDEDSGE